MLSNRLAFVAVAIACIGAAAGGGYLATRQNTVPMPASAQTTTAAPAQPAAVTVAPALGATAPEAKPVQETEGIVGDASRRPPAAAKTTSASKMVEVPARAAAPQPARAAAPRESRPVASRVEHQEAPPAVQGSAAPQPPASPGPAVIEREPVAAHVDERPAEPLRPADPPARTFTELVVSSDSVIGLQTENRVSSETARVEDRVDARVTRDVRVGDHVAIPAGARAIGSVMQVERGGKFKERARLGIRFHTLVLADGTRIPISTETIFREGDAPSSQAKVGGAAVGGAILGAILGGGKGMAIGAAAGAGAGSAAVMAGDRNAATLAAGSAMTVRILQPITVTRERE